MELPSIASFSIKGLGKFQDISGGYLEDFAGEKFDLAKLVPFDALFSPDAVLTDEGRSIFRASYHDGATTLIAEMDKSGTIIHAELFMSSPASTLYFVKTQECNQDELYVFAESQINDTDFEGLSFGDEGTSLDRMDDSTHMVAAAESMTQHTFVAGDSSSLDCRMFKVVKVGIVYDAEFCAKYGGKVEAESRIMLIVAAASLLFEHDMCVKLQLVGIHTPDASCSAPSTTFSSMPRDKACGSGATSETFIRYFADWMNENRPRTQLDTDAVVHAFTGTPPRGTLGCAYIGTACRTPKYAYGVNYMSSNFLSVQSIIFAHELAHNLNARHLTQAQSASKRYLMKRALQNPHDGFSPLSIQRVLEFLDWPDVTCDIMSLPSSTNEPTVATTAAPTQFPTSSPTESTLPPSPTCNLEMMKGEVMCFLSSERFGCVEASDLFRVKPNIFCAGRNPVIGRVALTSCFEETSASTSKEYSNDEGRKLRSKKRGCDHEDDDDNDEPYIESLNGSDPTASNDRGLPSFRAADCSGLGCTAVSNFVCFATELGSGQDEKIYVIGFDVVVDGRLDHLETTVRVTKQADSVEDTCTAAETICIDRF